MMISTNSSGEYREMKSTLILFLILSLYSFEVLAGPACDLDAFKKQYVDLQNALRYDGRKIELIKGKVKATNEVVDSDNSPGKKAEKALYKNYRAALGKVKKIYDYLKSPDKTSSGEKALLANPEVTNFFKAIDHPSSDDKSKLNINIDKLLDTLQSKVQGKDFALNANDVYLLKKLIIHSQDRICTLDKYVTPKNTNTTRVQYLEQLKNKPLNLMISQLQDMAGSEDAKFSNEDLAIDKAVEEGINNLHQMAQSCKNKLNSVNLGEPIQGCNYGRLIQSLSVDDKSFRSFEALLHFINTNQVAKDGRTSLNWIDEQLKKDLHVSCYVDQESKSLFIKNFPLKKEKVDATQFKCIKGNKEAIGEACLKGLSYEFVNGMGHKITASKQSDIKTITIKDSDSCANVSLTAPVITPPSIPSETEQQKCKKDPTKEWSSDNKCITLPKKCNKTECEGINGVIVQWHTTGNFCYKPPIDAEIEKAKARAFCNEVGDIGNSETEKSCQPKQEFDPAKKSCIETSASCADKKMSHDTNTKQCVETDDSCKLKNKIFDSATKTCKDAPQTGLESEESCKKKNQKFDSGKKMCVELAEQEKCTKLNEEWLEKQRADGNSPISRYKWNGKSCDDDQTKKDGEKGSEKEDELTKETVYPNKPAPGRFVPVTIPSRQIFILPGMR